MWPLVFFFSCGKWGKCAYLHFIEQMRPALQRQERSDENFVQARLCSSFCANDGFTPGINSPSILRQLSQICQFCDSCCKSVRIYDRLAFLHISGNRLSQNLIPHQESKIQGVNNASAAISFMYRQHNLRHFMKTRLKWSYIPAAKNIKEI